MNGTLGSSRFWLASALFAMLASLGSAQEKPRTGMKPPDEVEKTFALPAGLAASTWAHEPNLVNPTNMDIDERGRVWVTEAVNYRASKLAPDGDRIVILEDTKGMGRCDSVKVFVQDKTLLAPLGICVLGNKVYVAQSPKMLVYTIDAGGDKPAGPPDVLFDGFAGVNSDHGLHSIMAGPDGRLYFNAGNSGCEGLQLRNGKGEIVIDSTGSEVGGKGQKWRGGPRGPTQRYWQGMAFRCEADGSGFEVLGHNFRNNYEVTVDSYGTAWQSDNDDDGNQGVRINYVMEGGNFGYVGPRGSNWARDQNSAPGQTRQEAHWHQRDPGVVPNLLMTGGGSPAGICVYEGALLPEPFRGALLHAEAGANVVRAYSPVPAGAGYKCSSADLFKSSYSWVRPSDVCVGVDGAVYVADWTDSGVGGHATGDNDPATISGRIYRIAPTGTRAASPELDLSTPRGQIAALCSPNLARRFLGRQKLAAGGAGAVAALQELWTSPNPLFRARALWILARLPEGQATLRQALKDEDVNLRVTALRAARQNRQDMIEIARGMLADPHPFVARELCLAMNYEQTPGALEILVALADRVQPPAPVEESASKDFLEQERLRQERVLHKWYLEAFGIGCTGREKDVLEAWRKSGKNKDPKVAEILAWRLNRAEAPAPPPK
jgi:putative membrane-bound dehydrogenase-like protein